MAICSICVIKRFLFNIYCSCWRVYSLQTGRLIRNMAGPNSFARFSIWKCKMLRYLPTIFCFEVEEWLFSQLVICKFYSWKQIKACSLDAELIFGSNWSIIKLWSSYSSFQALLFIDISQFSQGFIACQWSCMKDLVLAIDSDGISIIKLTSIFGTVTKYLTQFLFTQVCLFHKQW